MKLMEKALLLCIIPNVVSAYEDTFTTDDGIEIKKTTIGTDGTLDFSVSNITLDEELEYQWGISKTKSAEGVVEWYGLSADVDNQLANFSLTDNEGKIKEILRTTDIAYLYIKNSDGTTKVIDGLKLDLGINPADSLKIKENTTWGVWQVYPIYDISPNAYQFVKVENGTDVPSNGWISFDHSYSDYCEINKSNWVKEDGTYYLWCKFAAANAKTMYAYKKITVDDNAPTVTSIKVVSPDEGTYNTPQTVKIRAYFSEAITGTTMPTLKIKFGDSAERSLTNGTIHNETLANYIEYSYNIQDGDKGQIMTVSYEGGDIKDSAGNEAKLTCPLITGNAIKANTNGNTTNNTDNQDKDNDLTNGDNNNNNNNNNSNNNSSPEWKNAKFELKRYNLNNAVVEISGVTPKAKRKYYLYISDNNNKPNITHVPDEAISLNYDENTKKFVFTQFTKLPKYVELNQELYANVIEDEEFAEGTMNIVSYGNKIERFAEPKYTDAFHSTIISDNMVQINTTFTHDFDTYNRKLQVKIGKITDTSILQKIANQDSSGFADLLNYAKSSNGIYDQIMSSTKETWIGTEDLINLAGLLEDDAYYFLYVRPDDENGKYFSNEAVTLAQAMYVKEDLWQMCFYGSGDFKWADFGNSNIPSTSNEDTTIAPTILPNTGKSVLILSFIVLGVGAIVFTINKNIKYRDI